MTPFVEINFNIVPRSVTSIKALDKNTWTISFKYSLESINIDFKIEQMLFC